MRTKRDWCPRRQTVAIDSKLSIREIFEPSNSVLRILERSNTGCQSVGKERSARSTSRKFVARFTVSGVLYVGECVVRTLHRYRCTHDI